MLVSLALPNIESWKLLVGAVGSSVRGSSIIDIGHGTVLLAGLGIRGFVFIYF
jgi:hypothetical protein